jgi:hypothetical protein
MTSIQQRIHCIMIVVFIFIFLSINSSEFSVDRADKIILILFADYHNISFARGKYKARHEAHTRRKSKNRSATVVSMDQASSLVKKERRMR